jgi:photosystem II stability/assembly factor-like uncharacterized protein
MVNIRTFTFIMRSIIFPFFCSLLFPALCAAQLQWHVLNSPTNVKLRTGIFVNDSIGIAVGDSNTIIRTSDGGNTWKIIKQDTFIYPRLWTVACNPLSPNGSPIIASGDDSIAYRSTDGGETWSAITNGLPGGNSSITTHIQVLDDTTIYSAGGIQSGKTTVGMLTRSSDGGNTWHNEFPFNGYYYLRSVYFFNDTTGFTLGVYSQGGGSLFKTEDMGNTWLKKEEFPPFQFTSMTFSDRNNGFVAGFNGVSLTETNGVILRSSDGGVTWLLTQSLPGLRSVHFSDANRGFACGGRHIIETFDTGVNWSDAGYSGNFVFNSIYAGHGKVFAVGENGAMVLAELTPSSVAKEPSVLNANAYPNPMTAFTKIVLPKDATYDIEIVDILGKTVRRFSVSASEAIIQKGELSSGAYRFIVHNTSNGSVVTGKIVIE